MTYMRGDLLTKMRKLVKGLACPTPKWLKAMELAPPVTFPRAEPKIETIKLPEDKYVRRFFKKHPDSLYHDAVRSFDNSWISDFDPPPARIFAWRVLELMEQGVTEDIAMAVADMEYRNQKKARKKAYSELKQICRLQGKKPPPNPYPSAIKEIQAEEKKFVRDRFFNPKVLEIVKQMKADKAAEFQERQSEVGGDRSYGGQQQRGGWNGGGQQPRGGWNGGGQPGGWGGGRSGGQPGGWGGGWNTGGRQ
ncbi:hypothetical protein ZIOFF_073631 [Zingiber officinale]|uniref:Small ribosomal subunit protein mS23 n=1 Tax=Zingiber officinale TaxID=94328 RepID=A0A8J5BY64_ZINOF|nr:hypothetical protein ZIOFF_073631 [Zingiber officinale]